MPKVIKEIIIVLLAILVSMLALAVVLYDYLPNKIQTKETITYSATDSVKELFQDSVAQDNSEVILTYEVTGSDLNRFEKDKEYVPGKQNPFAVYTEPVEETDENGNTISGTTDGASQSSSKNTTNTTTTNTTATTNSTKSYFKENGTK